MLILNMLELLFACKPEPGSTLVEDNIRTGFIGLSVIVFAFIIHLIINKFVFNKIWKKSLFLYLVMFVLQALLVFTVGMGDCGFMFAGGGTIFAIISGFWVIAVPLISRAIEKHRQNLIEKTTPPFAKPINDFKFNGRTK